MRSSTERASCSECSSALFVNFDKKQLLGEGEAVAVHGPPLLLKMGRMVTRADLLGALEQGGFGIMGLLREASADLRGDRGIMMKAVSHEGSALGLATDELRGDRRVVTEAVTQFGQALRYATEELRGDREIVRQALLVDSQALQYAAHELRDDRDIVMEAVSKNGFALRFATEALKGDREVVRTAVAQEGSALTCATEVVRKDREIAMQAVSQNWRAIKCASEELRADESLARAAFAASGSPPNAVGLKVALLSGRCCVQVFDVEDHMDDVMEEIACLLGLNAQQVVARGTLVSGDVTVISSLGEIQPGLMHELTLVLS